ncbi:MAG: cisplatin damage response ATP-dependent DNA ligase [Alphaproteobacteria bacterium]|nr:cisplatin damage response ATP-dependent DNA ligase [Alphaproteobacteria bacterium]
MMAFSALLDALSYAPARTAKLRLLADYFGHAPDPDRGYALAALTGCLSFPHAKPAMVRDLAVARIDPVLFGLSYDYVGDLAETVALAWPERPGRAVPSLGAVVTALTETPKAGLPRLVEGWLDGLDATGRWALLKLITGGLRVGVSARLAKTALAEWGGVPLDEVEEVWHGMAPPFPGLFAWAEGRAGRPLVDHGAQFRPFMLATALDEAELDDLDPSDYAAEWKWDGIRVQLNGLGERRLFARSGDDLAAAFPDLLAAVPPGVLLDGELLVWGGEGRPAPFADLQRRLNRKAPDRKLIEAFPAHVRLYDLLIEDGEDLRPRPFAERRARLERWMAAGPRPRLDLSPLIPFADWDALRSLRAGARDADIEGLMLKRRDSPYLAGRPKGPWFKWKRDPLTADAVLMYAQRGHGKRSSFYSDYTFGVWAGDALVPVGKAYFGFTDEELRLLDRWVRENTVNRFGPVREVRPGLVFEVAFDGVRRSARHRSGLALRFPRIARIRWDKPAAEADRLEAVEALLAHQAKEPMPPG